MQSIQNEMHRLVEQPAGAVVRAHQLGKRVSMGEATLDIVKDISFSLDAGTTLAIVGESGSGKSTLLGLLAGLDEPTSGEVQLAGQSLQQLNEDQRAALRARHVGFVFQSFQLLPALSALDNVALPLELAGARDALSRAEQMLKAVGLGHRLSHRPKALSGGEQQRVALARAFVARPTILFADEPTGNLDQETGAHIVDQLFALNAEHGTTLILVTHDVLLAARCQRRIRLKGGMIVEDSGAQP
ncbi:ABC transporter ATP-binding protein [Burkholderiaceae bacterium DAT-1]|nr:ABC transporter ATP-binding protein [Burkholderiaceae bacterium DAT-1]